MSIKPFIKRNNMELQFWGYEGGNVAAAVAGAGGVAAFGEQILTVANDELLNGFEKVSTLFADHPDVTVTLGIGSVVVLAPVIRKAAEATKSQLSIDAVDATTLTLSAGILSYALLQDTSWITTAGSSFVVGSSMLRYASQNPVMMKAGSLALAFGGAALAMFGLDGFSDPNVQHSIVTHTMNTLMIGTGTYVGATYLLTYEGGKYLTENISESDKAELATTSLAGLVHPDSGAISGAFESVLDRPISYINEKAVRPALFWVPSEAKANEPFTTSMVGKMPWRVAAGGAGLYFEATGQMPGGLEFFIANVGWALGDYALGSEDWDLEEEIVLDKGDDRDFTP